MSHNPNLREKAENRYLEVARLRAIEVLSKSFLGEHIPMEERKRAKVRDSALKDPDDVLMIYTEIPDEYTKRLCLENPMAVNLGYQNTCSVLKQLFNKATSQADFINVESYNKDLTDYMNKKGYEVYKKYVEPKNEDFESFQYNRMLRRVKRAKKTYYLKQRNEEIDFLCSIDSQEAQLGTEDARNISSMPMLGSEIIIKPEDYSEFKKTLDTTKTTSSQSIGVEKIYFD